MSFPRYPKYKDSGVKWLGEVPAHWDVRKMKWVAKMESGHTPNKKVPEYWENGNIPWVSLNDTGYLKEHNYISDTAYQVTELGIANSSAHLLPVRAVVFSRDATIGRCAITTRPMAVSQHFIAWICRDSMTPEYLLQVLRSMTQELDSLTTGATLKTIGMPEVRTLVTPVPPFGEQVAVTAFLNRETAKIDTLVAEQQRLIDLLKEKRQAVISHAVTKGLNPNVPMKSSGFEWLGDVPAHWAVLPLKRLIAEGTSISYGIVQPGEPLEDGVPFVQTTNMSTGDFALANLQKTTIEIAGMYPRSRLSGGEVILGIRASIGSAHVVPQALAGANLSRGVARIVPGSKVSSRYLVAYFGTAAVSWYWELSKQGSTFNEVSIETVRDLTVCVPPTDEQAAITEYVDIEVRRFDVLTAEAQRAIDLLQERRSALISAAVTGQIDVRGLTERTAA